MYKEIALLDQALLLASLNLELKTKTNHSFSLCSEVLFAVPRIQRNESLLSESLKSHWQAAYGGMVFSGT